MPGTATGTPTRASTGTDGIDIADDFGPKRIDDLFTFPGLMFQLPMKFRVLDASL